MRVLLSPHTINRIAAEAATVARNNIPAAENVGYIWGVSNEVAKAAYNAVFDQEKQEQFKKILPDWGYRSNFEVQIGVVLDPKDDKEFKRTSCYSNGVVTDGVFINGNGFVGPSPGIKRAHYYNGNIILQPEEDTSLIQDDELRVYVERCVRTQRDTIMRREVAEKAEAEMKALLSNYGTFQKAVKEHGEALVEFLPYDLLELYRREPPKRPKPKPPQPSESKPDVDFLIAQAGIKALGLGQNNALDINF